MQIGSLTFNPVEENYDLVAASIRESVEGAELSKEIFVAKINPELADTATFCEYYDIGLDVSANCVIVEARRGDKTWYAACVILATTRADVNGVVRRQLDARKISFAPMDKAVSLSSMEYGGITPIGLPNDWPLLIDVRVNEAARVIIGSGIRGSKLLIPGKLLSTLHNAQVIDITKSS